jgi:4'-phosphopantetheinyl transferase
MDAILVPNRPGGNGASVSFAPTARATRLQSDAVSLYWLSQGMADAPGDDGWLSPRESAWIARMRFPKRRTEFRLGRWTAKKALALYLGREAKAAALRSIEIDRAKDGAPLPLVDGGPADAYLTMTDRADQAVCLVGPPGTALGCDLELVEPRSDAFVGDFLTPAEQALVAAAAGGDAHDLLANLVWCGKESALKVLRTGLRRDTRSVEVSFPEGASVDGWAPMRVRGVEGTVFPGWWQRFGAFVLTVAATRDFTPPQPFVDPPGLAVAVPGESWRDAPSS